MIVNEPRWYEIESAYCQIVDEVYEILEDLKRQDKISFVNDIIDFTLGTIWANRIRVIFNDKDNRGRYLDIPVDTMYDVGKRIEFINNFKPAG